MGLGKFWNVQTEFDRENPMNNTESEGRIIQLSCQYTFSDSKMFSKILGR